MRDLGNDGEAKTAGAVAMSAPSILEIEAFARRMAADAVGLDDVRLPRSAACRQRDVTEGWPTRWRWRCVSHLGGVSSRCRWR